ncbi:MAG TPA: hypothetical protein ENN41_08925 [Sediminispirochaeta sp.]|nr:hypothetical protein [Sediminispirochaeta sp.]
MNKLVLYISGMHKLRSTKRVLFSILLLSLLAAATLPAADLSVSDLELITRGRWENQRLLLSTRGRSEISLSGGYKFGGNLQLGFESSDLSFAGADSPDYGDYTDADAYSTAVLEYLDKQTNLEFRGADIIYRGVFGSDVDLSYFIGHKQRLVSAETFPDVFGSRPISTKYQGYLYFPKLEYRGIHSVRGTGLEFSSDFGDENIRGNLYLYQDSLLPEGNYSTDVQFMLSQEQLKIELFAGASFPQGEYGLYRGGFLFYYRPAERGEFFAQIGLPYYRPFEQLTIDDFYFLFEPRVHFDYVSIITTLFWHPERYLMQETGDAGSADIHFNLLFGDQEKNPITGGFETNFNLETSDTGIQDFSITTSPYLSAVTSGVIWNFMVNVTLLPYSLEDMFEGIIGVKAVF